MTTRAHKYPCDDLSCPQFLCKQETENTEATMTRAEKIEAALKKISDAHYECLAPSACPKNPNDPLRVPCVARTALALPADPVPAAEKGRCYACGENTIDERAQCLPCWKATELRSNAKDEVIEAAREVLTAECNNKCFCSELVKRPLARLAALDGEEK